MDCFDTEVQEQAPERAKSSSWKFYVIFGILGTYAVVMTAYSVYLRSTAIVPQPTIHTDSPSISKLPSEKTEKTSQSEDGQVDKEPSKVETKNKSNFITPEIDEVVKEVLPREDYRMVRKGWKMTKQLVNPTRVVMNTLTSFVASLATAAVLFFLAYIAYMSTQKATPLLLESTIKTCQNYARLATAIGSGGLLISALVVYFDREKWLAGSAHVSAVFFALICVACCFFFTFAELTMNAQLLELPDIHDGLFTGKTASSVMTWATSFLQVNMSTLGSGLMIMWIAHFVAQWAVKSAEGSTVHKVCSIIALPMTALYMSARRSGNIIHTMFRLALTVISFALTINLLTPD